LAIYANLLGGEGMIDFPNFIKIKIAFDVGILSVDNMQRTVKENYVSPDQYQTIVGEVYPVKTNKPHLLTASEYAAFMGVKDEVTQTETTVPIE